MKKVSVQFNLVVGDRTTHKLLKALLEAWAEPDYKITSIQINNIESKRGRDATNN